MTESRKIVIRETCIVLIGESICSAIMLAVFAMLKKLSLSVLLGAVVGVLITVINFFFMAIVASLAADKAEKQDVIGGKRLVQVSYPLRLIVLCGVVFACGSSGYFHPFALILPIAFFRPIMMITSFFRKG